MENVVRGLSGLTVANGMNGQATFSSIDSARAAPYLCNQRRFPIFLGANSGSTSITLFKHDSAGNVAVSGSSNDPDFITSSLFIGLLKDTGFNFTWVNELSAGS